MKNTSRPVHRGHEPPGREGDTLVRDDAKRLMRRDTLVQRLAIERRTRNRAAAEPPRRSGSPVQDKVTEDQGEENRGTAPAPSTSRTPHC